MEYGQAIKAAHHTVQESGIPGDLHEAAFTQILRHMLDGHPGSANGDPALSKMPDASGADTGLERLAARLSIDAVLLADIYEIDGTSVSLHIASSRIAQSKSKATQEIALLIAAARQGSGIDDSWTEVSLVREALQNYRRYDTNNFSSYLKRATEEFNFRGKGVSAELRLTKRGWEAVMEFINSLNRTE